jgi:hypothetical protein
VIKCQDLSGLLSNPDYTGILCITDSNRLISYSGISKFDCTPPTSSAMLNRSPLRVTANKEEYSMQALVEGLAV